MANKSWYVIGLMSGTSLDGVDLVYVKFTLDHGYSFEILEKKSINYSELWKNRLFNAFEVSGEILSLLHSDYGKYLGELVVDFIAEKGIEKIDFLASHGHTIFHRPERGYTLQIGSGAHMAAITGIKVICDFRTQDVALGGQGAPLVPVGDGHLFNDYDFCLNLGGFANLSYQEKEQRIAYDICPANIVLNHYTRKTGLEYDDRGGMASRGNIAENLLSELNKLPFYQGVKPKSLGYEFVVETVLPMIDAYDLKLQDVLRTFVEHSAFQIAKVINTAVNESGIAASRTLISGGGAFNDFLIERIATLTQTEIIIPAKEIIEFKEAVIFAFLGVLRDQNEVNCLKSVTGASKDHSSGVIFSV